LSVTCRYGKVVGVPEDPDLQTAAAGRTAPPVRALSSQQQPATRADLYAAVDALRADMRELMDMVRTADRRVSDLERAGGDAGHRPRFDDDEW
jgi:hypothetical protein